jgi:dolichol-phosphate mannosyltransferase
VICETHRRLVEVLDKVQMDWELIYVDDGSADATWDILKELQTSDNRVRVLRFTRNFGHQLAISAGLEHASGEAVVLIDADLQDPPECILDMVALWRDGYDVVYGQRTERVGESAFKLWTAKWFYRLINRLTEIKTPLDAGDFRLMDRRVVEALKAMPERDRYVRGLVSWVGFRQTALPYRREARLAGKTKYPLNKMLRFALDGILSFSLVPLKLATGLGFIAAFFALLGIIYALILRLFTTIWISGWTLLFIALLFLGGVQLICLGIIGEYVGRSYYEAKRRPLYLIWERLGFPNGGPSQPGSGKAR